MCPVRDDESPLPSLQTCEHKNCLEACQSSISTYSSQTNTQTFSFPHILLCLLKQAWQMNDYTIACNHTENCHSSHPIKILRSNGFSGKVLEKIRLKYPVLQIPYIVYYVSNILLGISILNIQHAKKYICFI